MKLFYLDESGNPELSGSSGSYVLVAVGIPIEKWTYCDKCINQLKASYNLSQAEIHTAWMLRTYWEQEEIEGFESMSPDERRVAVIAERERRIQKHKSSKSDKALKNMKKTYKNTEAYIHLTYKERERFIFDLVSKIKSWTFIRIFAEIIDKNEYHPPQPDLTPATQAFERIVTRIEKYLSHISNDQKEYGLLIHDECESVQASHVCNMRQYQRRGTFKSDIKHIIETPLFVSSRYTNMVQIADCCAYALRRYYDSEDTSLYTVIKTRADKIGADVVGFNHYTFNGNCTCDLCISKRRRKGIK